MKTTKALVEIVCCTVEDAIAAEAGGADRIELCSALQVGGLTPSLGLLRAVKANISIPVMAMVRPRPSGFCYSETELAVMRSDAEMFVDAGADGIVFGCLSEDRKIQWEASRQMVEMAGSHESVFHRAFDMVADSEAALETLIDCGVTRILTSGQVATAFDGALNIRRLIELAAGRVQILPGGGIRSVNAAAIVALAGCDQVHLAPRSPRTDSTSVSEGGVDYGSDGIVLADDVRNIVAALSH